MSKTTKRHIDIMFALAGKEHVGLTNSQITTALGMPDTKRCVISKDLKDLKNIGLVEFFAHNSKLWRNTPKISQLSRKVERGYMEAIGKVEELNQRHTRNL